MKIDNLYIIGGDQSKLSVEIAKNSQVVFFDKLQTGFNHQFSLIKKFKDQQHSLSEKWLNFQEIVFKKLIPLINKDEEYRYLLSNLFFEASNYKTNTVYQFYKLHLIINHIKEENIKNIFLINVPQEIQKFFDHNSKILSINLNIISIQKKNFKKKNIIINSIFFQLFKELRKKFKNKYFKIQQHNKVVLCQCVLGSQSYNNSFRSKYFEDVSILLNNNYSWLFHGVGNFSENREYKKIIKSNIRSYGFLNNYLYYFDFLKIIYSFNRIRKKFKIINIRNLFIFEGINYYNLFKQEWLRSISNVLLDSLFYEKKFQNFFKKNSKISEILYLLEFHPWESMLNKVAKKSGIKTKGITHINIRPNLMQYYHSKLIYSYSYFPTLVGINSEFSKKIFLKSGFNFQQLHEIEAHRYNYLSNYLDKSIPKKKKINKSILITTSINPLETREMLEVFSLSNVNFDKIYLKEHPSLSVNSIIKSIKSFPDYEIVSGSMSDALKFSDIVYTANGSSTLIESVLSKKYTVTLFTLSSLPTPAFENATNLYFAYDETSLSEILKKLIKNEEINDFTNDLKNDLYLNKNLNLWSRFLNQ